MVGQSLGAVVRDQQALTPFLLHTNSYLDADLAGEETDPDACPRMAAARRFYAEGVPTDAAGVRAILSDHTGGICVHPPQGRTIVSFVAKLRGGRIRVTGGNPCCAPEQLHCLHT